MPAYRISADYSAPRELGPAEHARLSATLDAAALATLQSLAGYAVPVAVLDALTLLRAWRGGLAAMEATPTAPPLSPVAHAVLGILASPVFREHGARGSQVADRAGASSASTFRTLARLRERGLVAGGKSHPYRITEAGLAALTTPTATPVSPIGQAAD
jgi:hypothetical protein